MASKRFLIVCLCLILLESSHGLPFHEIIRGSVSSWKEDTSKQNGDTDANEKPVTEEKMTPEKKIKKDEIEIPENTTGQVQENKKYTFLKSSAILKRPFWKGHLLELYEILYRIAHPDATEKEVKDFLAMKKGQLRRLSMEQLRTLFWIIHNAIESGQITDDGRIIIDGVEYDLGDLITFCCPFG